MCTNLLNFSALFILKLEFWSIWIVKLALILLYITIFVEKELWHLQLFQKGFLTIPIIVIKKKF